MDNQGFIKHWGYGVLLAIVSLFFASIDIPPVDTSYKVLPMFIALLLIVGLSILTAYGVLGIMLFIVKQISKLTEKLAGFSLFKEIMIEVQSDKTIKAFINSVLANTLKTSLNLTVAISVGFAMSPMIERLTNGLAFLGSFTGLAFAYAVGIAFIDLLLLAWSFMVSTETPNIKRKRQAEIAYEGNDSSEQWRVKRDGKEDFVTMDRLELIYHTLDIAKEEQQT